MTLGTVVSTERLRITRELAYGLRSRLRVGGGWIAIDNPLEVQSGMIITVSSQLKSFLKSLIEERQVLRYDREV